MGAAQVAAQGSDRPKCLTLPSRISALTVAATLRSESCGSTRCWYSRSMVSIFRRFSDPSTAARMRAGLEFDARLLAGFRVEMEAEFGGDHHLVAERRQRLANHLLVGEGAIHLGGVEKGHATLEGGADQRDAAGPVDAVALSIAEIQPHAAEAQS